MSPRAIAAAACLPLLLFHGGPALAARPEVHPSRVQVSRQGPVLRLEVTLPGLWIVESAPGRNGDGSTTMFVLARARTDKAGEQTEENFEREAQAVLCNEPLPPRSLYEIPFVPGAEPRQVVPQVPVDTRGLLVLDAAGPGDRARVFLVRGRALDAVGASGALETVLEERAPFTVQKIRDDLVAAVRLGSWSLHRLGSGVGACRPLAWARLPVEASLTGDDIWLTGEPPHEIGRRDRESLVAAGPVAQGATRLRTSLLRVQTDGQTVVEDCWARLPAPERLLESGFVMANGEPLLVITTFPRRLLSFFGEKRLRVYPLHHDRTRLGAAPLLAVESRMNLWQDATFHVADANGDGRDDLVIQYEKGLVKNRLVLDVYLRTGDGRFAERARTTAFNLPPRVANALYGKDWTGDGRPDLLLVGRLSQIWPGIPSQTGTPIVSPEAIPVPALPWRLEDARPCATSKGRVCWEWVEIQGGAASEPTRVILVHYEPERSGDSGKDSESADVSPTESPEQPTP